MKSGCYLGIETSTPLGSIAVGDGHRILAEVVLGENTRHSEALLPAIDFMLKNAGLEKSELTGVVVGGGPGSFTGLRIAGATAKGLAYALDIPLFAYSGLLALAAAIGNADQDVCALFDAKRGEVYAACYRFPKMMGFEAVLEPAPQAIKALLDSLDVARTVFVGDGALRNDVLIRAAGGILLPAHLAVPRASALLWLRDVAPGVGRVEDVAGWEPMYLRESGAERMRPR